MPKYISLLRGINIAGKNLIPMHTLKMLYESIGLQDPHTYLQSGNVVYTAEQSDKILMQQTIEQAIKSQFRHDVAVRIFDANQWDTIISENRLYYQHPTILSHLHLTTLASDPPVALEQILTDKASPSEKVQVYDKQIYLYCPDGYGRTKLTNNYIEQQANSIATTRNWNTVLKLQEKIST